MTIKIIEDRPDTCTCIYKYTYDDQTPDDQVVYQLHSIVHRGDEHSYVVDSSLLSVITEENQRKNRGVFHAETVAGVPAAWSYDPGRTLTIWFPGSNVPAATKQAIQEWCDTNLIGPVVIE